MSGPSPYNALYEIFGHERPTKHEDYQRHIKIIKKSIIQRSNIHDENKNNIKPMKIDNACQTQPLRDYSYNKVVGPSKLKTIHGNDSTKIDSRNISFSSNDKEQKKITLSSVGMHLKNSRVSALYKTISDIEKIFREERNLHLHSKKCLCSSCGALGVITESMKHPVNFGYSSSESDDDESDESDDEDDDDDDDENTYNEDDEDEYHSMPPQYNSSKRSWKIEYKDSECIKYGNPTAKGYVKLIMELERMTKRVKSLERLAIKNNIPIKRNKVDMTYDIQTQRVNNVSKKTIQSLSSTSSSEIDKAQCGIFSIPNAIRRKFTKKQNFEVNEVKKTSTNLRSNNYKFLNNDTQAFTEKKNTQTETNKKYQANCLDEKIQNFDLSLLNEDEICELMFHLKNKNTNYAKRMKEKSMVTSDIEQNIRKLKTQKPISNHTHKTENTPFKMISSPVGLRTIIDKVNHKSLRNDKILIRKSHNYLGNDFESNRNTKKILRDFLKINDVTPNEHYNETDAQNLRKILCSKSNSNEDSSNFYNSTDTIEKLNLDIKQRSAINKTNQSKETLLYKPSKSTICSKRECVNENVSESNGIIEEKHDHNKNTSNSTLKSKISKTVRYSKQNEYHYFNDTTMKTCFSPTEIGESSGLCKQICQITQSDSSDSDSFDDSESYFAVHNNKQIKMKKILTINSSQIHLKNSRSENKHDVSDVLSKSKSSLINMDQKENDVKIAAVPTNKCKNLEIEPNILELQTQNESVTSKTPIKYSEKISEFINDNIVEKTLTNENSSNQPLMDRQNLFKEAKEEIKSIQIHENKKIENNAIFHKEDKKETKEVQTLESYKDIANNNGKIKKETKSSQTCVENKSILKKCKYLKKENKEIQVTDLNEKIENTVFFKKDNSRIPKIVNIKIVKNDNKDNEVTTKIQKNIAEIKNCVRKVNEKLTATKQCEVNKSIVKKKSCLKNRENKIIQTTKKADEEQNNKSSIMDKKEINFVPKSELSKIKPNENLNRINSEAVKKIQQNEKRKPVIENENFLKQDNAVKYSELLEQKKNFIKDKDSNIKESRETQVTEINKEEKNIIEEIHECPLIYKNNSFLSSDGKNNNSDLTKKSILKTYKRAPNTVLTKLERKNSLVNKFKKHVNINIVNKVSSSVINDIFKTRASNSEVLSNVFQRKMHNMQDKNNKKRRSKIPVAIFHQSNNKTLSYIPKISSKIPTYINKSEKETNYKSKFNLKIFQKKNAGETQRNTFLHYNVKHNKPTIKFCKKKEIINLNNTITKEEPIKKCCNLPKHFSMKKKHSKIPISQIVANEKQQTHVCNKLSPSTFLNDNNLITDGKKATIFTSVTTNNVNNEFSSIPQNLQLYPAILTTFSSFDKKRQSNNELLPKNSVKLNESCPQIENIECKIVTSSKDDSMELPANSNKSNSNNPQNEKVQFLKKSKSIEILRNPIIKKNKSDSTDNIKALSFDSLNTCNSQIEKIEFNKNSESTHDKKILPVDSDILSSYTSQIYKVKYKKGINSIGDAKLLPADSDVLHSYNSQIDKVERKLFSNSADYGKISNESTIESINIQNDITEDSSSYTTPPYGIITCESFTTISEDNSGTIFIYKSQCQLSTERSNVESENDTHISESIYTSTSDLNPSKGKGKWKWLKTFGNKFKYFLSNHVPKSSTAENLLRNGNITCNETSEKCSRKHSKKDTNEKDASKHKRAKRNIKPKTSSLSFTFTLKKKNTNSSTLSN